MTIGLNLHGQRNGRYSGVLEPFLVERGEDGGRGRGGGEEERAGGGGGGGGGCGETGS